MLEQRAAFDLAVRNIARWGDTDVFPFAPENHILFDQRESVVDLLMQMHADLDAALLSYPALRVNALSLITYEGLRWVTQIDPLWNAYFLGVVLAVSPEIEAARLPPTRRTTFSYRLSINHERSALFEEGAWRNFSEQSVELAHEYQWVVQCDIADFYSRIYHHRLENALRLLSGVGDVPNRIDKLLRNFSGGPSYGLPVGGPASRLLAELALNRTDRLLATRGITFCRYADDYRLFAPTRNDAFRALLTLSDLLLGNEGLTLQRQKTRVIASKDFLRTPELLPEDSDELSPWERQERRFLALSLRYDPYSATAVEDYERLKGSLEQFDILGMLTQEVNKSRISTPLVRRLVQTLALLPDDVRISAAETLVRNLEVLAPALPVVLRVLTDLMPSLPDQVSQDLARRIREGIRGGDYYLLVPVNLAYALRALQHDRSEDTISLATELFEHAMPFIQRDIVYLMYGWDADYWLSDKRRQWVTQHAWVKRALLLASYGLSDEGRHWRSAVRDQITGLDAIAREWMQNRIAQGHTELPL